MIHAMDRRVEEVAELINTELHRSPSASVLARAVNLSESRLRHIFKRQLGISLSRYVRTIKMQRAADLASTTFLTVKEIMVSVGFRDESHFVRDFEKVYGLSPREYRTAHRPDSALKKQSPIQ